MFRSRVDVDQGTFVKIAVNHEVIQLLGEDGSCVRIDQLITKESEFQYSKLNGYNLLVFIFDFHITSYLESLTTMLKLIFHLIIAINFNGYMSLYS